jgi:hypothetical protein
VQPIGRKNRKGTMGSYYSISDYTAINPELGTMADFDALVAAAHRDGMKVLLDWVPNHTAFDHPWITQHKDWYVTRPDGTIVNARDNEGHDTDWTDVAELNYDNPELRRAMIDAMRWWLERGHVDGFRCDVAGGVPLDFWLQARTALRAVRPDLFMLAESEDPRLHAAFDMTYGWDLHHLLNEIAQGKRPAPALDAYLARQDSVFGRDAYRLYFTSNHDENSWNGSEFERMGANAQAAFVLAATLRGSMPLLYTGQEVSVRKRLRFFEKDTVDWSGPSLAPFYRSLFDLKHQHEALANGAAGGQQADPVLLGHQTPGRAGDGCEGGEHIGAIAVTHAERAGLALQHARHVGLAVQVLADAGLVGMIEDAARTIDEEQDTVLAEAQLDDAAVEGAATVRADGEQAGERAAEFAAVVEQRDRDGEERLAIFAAAHHIRIAGG